MSKHDRFDFDKPAPGSPIALFQEIFVFVKQVIIYSAFGIALIVFLGFVEFFGTFSLAFMLNHYPWQLIGFMIVFGFSIITPIHRLLSYAFFLDSHQELNLIRWFQRRSHGQSNSIPLEMLATIDNEVRWFLKPPSEENAQSRKRVQYALRIANSTILASILISPRTILTMGLLTLVIYAAAQLFGIWFYASRPYLKGIREALWRLDQDPQTTLRRLDQLKRELQDRAAPQLRVCADEPLNDTEMADLQALEATLEIQDQKRARETLTPHSLFPTSGDFSLSINAPEYSEASNHSPFSCYTLIFPLSRPKHRTFPEVRCEEPGSMGPGSHSLFSILLDALFAGKTIRIRIYWKIMDGYIDTD